MQHNNMQPITMDAMEGRLLALAQQRDAAMTQAVMLAGRVAELEAQLSKRSEPPAEPDSKVVQ